MVSEQEEFELYQADLLLDGCNDVEIPPFHGLDDGFDGRPPIPQRRRLNPTIKRMQDTISGINDNLKKSRKYESKLIVGVKNVNNKCIENTNKLNEYQQIINDNKENFEYLANRRNNDLSANNDKINDLHNKLNEMKYDLNDFIENNYNNNHNINNKNNGDNGNKQRNQRKERKKSLDKMDVNEKISHYDNIRNRSNLRSFVFILNHLNIYQSESRMIAFSKSLKRDFQNVIECGVLNGVILNKYAITTNSMEFYLMSNIIDIKSKWVNSQNNIYNNTNYKTDDFHIKLKKDGYKIYTFSKNGNKKDIIFSDGRNNTMTSNMRYFGILAVKYIDFTLLQNDDNGDDEEDNDDMNNNNNSPSPILDTSDRKKQRRNSLKTKEEYDQFLDDNDDNTNNPKQNENSMTLPFFP